MIMAKSRHWEDILKGDWHVEDYSLVNQLSMNETE